MRKTRGDFLFGLSLILSFALFFPSRLPASEKPLQPPETEPLEIWGKIPREDSLELSSEHLEKMAVAFDKINNPLCAAAVSGNVKDVDYLLRDGASPDSTDSLGISALSHAILGNSKEAVSRLLSAGANINQKGPFGVTPLMLAANSSRTEMVSFLLLNGADRNIKNDDGETALTIAKRKNLHEIIVLLEPPQKKITPLPAPQAAPEMPKKPQESSVPAAVSTEAAPALLAPAPPKKPAVPLSALDLELLQAVKQGMGEMMDRLIQKGANPDVRTPEGISPLVIAVTQNDRGGAELLLKNKANPNIRTEFEMTPLMIAAQNAKPEMVRLLLRYGADPRKENIAGQSSCDFGLASANPVIQELFKACLR